MIKKVYDFVKDVLSTLYGDGVLKMKNERYWLMEIGS